MNKSAWPALAGLLLCCAVFDATIASAGESPAFAPSPPSTSTSYLFCVGTQPKHQLADESMVPDAVYYSGAFSVTSPNLNPVSEAFITFLQERYDFHSAPSLAQPIACYSLPSLAEAQTQQQMYLSRIQKYSDRQKVVDTGWVFGQPQAA
jgi:hypothetical protein